MTFNQFHSGFQKVINKLDEVGTTVQNAVSTIFKKDLNDLVSVIRANKGNEAKCINDCIQEIREELKSIDHEEKANAVLKLTYLQMLGYSMDWASFRVIEVISQPKFSEKRIGYLAATQSFSESTDVMVLITNMIRKDCLSPNMYDGGLALNCLAHICTTELARDLVTDIVSMLSSARPYIRKKAVLVMYKIFLKFPDALRPTFPRLKEKLDDDDLGVVSAAVNVLCELAKKNARNYLSLAPTLFKLLTKNTNNWMLIKIIKMFALLIPLEERLGKKLAEPLCNIINSTNSMSLLYEAICTSIIGLSSYRNVMQLCISKLRMFIEHIDQNLKYLGLLALSKIIEVFPKGLTEHRDIILRCLEDEDQTIRLRAVELLVMMVDKNNLSFIVDKLRHYLDTAEGPYRDEVLQKIIHICSQDKYKFITDFDWYLGVLIDLTHVKGVKNGNIVSTQILDVSVRVKIVRASAVRHMVLLLQDSTLFTEDVQAGGMCEALYAAAWVIGEYADLCEDHYHAIDTLTQPDTLKLPAHIQSIFIHNAIKVFAVLALVGKTPEDHVPKNPTLDAVLALLKTRLPLFTSSPHIEVLERATFFGQLLRIFEEQWKEGVNIGEELAVVAADALNPVSVHAQERVPKPENLDLEAWINEPIPEEEDIFRTSKDEDYHPGSSYNQESPSYVSGYHPPDPAEIERRKLERQEEIKDIPWYIRTASEPVQEPGFNEDQPVRDGSTYGRPMRGGPIRGRFARGPIRGRGGRLPRPMAPTTIITEEENPEGWTEKEPSVPKNVDPLSQPLDLISPPTSLDSLPVRRHRPDIITPPSAHTTVPTGPPSVRGRATPSGRAPMDGRRGRRGRAPPHPLGSGRVGLAGRGRAGRGRGPAPGAQRKGPNPRIVPLCKDQYLIVDVELLASHSQKSNILAQFYFKNQSDKEIQNIQFTFANSLNLRPAPHPDRQPGDPIQTKNILPPGGVNIFRLLFEYETFIQPQQLTGAIDHTEGRMEFTMTFPCSAFILPETLDKNKFYGIVSKDAQEIRITQLHTTLQRATARICGQFRVKVVEESHDKVSMYGKTVHDNHVAFLVKKDGGDEKLGVAIKSENASLATSLLQEIERMKW